MDKELTKYPPGIFQGHSEFFVAEEVAHALREIKIDQWKLHTDNPVSLNLMLCISMELVFVKPMSSICHPVPHE
jgi:hypothetical protein